jgi:prepilin-type N-terminal cleavage/methylation domain-containing protein
MIYYTGQFEWCGRTHLQAVLRPTKNGRAGFTLLEMVLALAIGVMLMTGLYYALDLHLAATTSGRLQVDQAQIARNVLRKIQHDIKDHLATLDVYQSTKSSASSSAASSSTTGGTTAGTTGSTGSMTTTTNTGPFPFNLGVQGDQDWCTIYVSVVPYAVVQAQTSDPTAAGGANVQSSDSDLRRITYWYSATSGSTGLARQEIKLVTSDDGTISTLPPPGIDDMTEIVAPEVVAISFEYFDGSSWQPSWDGTQPGPDGVTPLGPPVAIAVTVNVARSDNLNANPDDPGVRRYRHVIEIPTASRYTMWPTNTSNPSATPQSSTGTTGG